MDAYYWNKRLNPFWLNTVRQLYKSGGNITEFLREEFDESSNSSEIIEIAYDAQAGNVFSEYTTIPKETELINSNAEELYSHLIPHLFQGCSLMDVGTGELLTLSLVCKNIDIPIDVFAFDISWSRLYKGRKFWNQNITNQILNLSTFVADMKKIPDLVFVIETNYESLAIKESIKLNIPIVAILDTNSNPEGIDFPIPGNDDARRSIDLYCNLIKETIQNAKKNIPETKNQNIEKDPKSTTIEKKPPKQKVKENKPAEIN